MLESGNIREKINLNFKLNITQQVLIKEIMVERDVQLYAEPQTHQEQEGQIIDANSLSSPQPRQNSASMTMVLQKPARLQVGISRAQNSSDTLNDVVKRQQQAGRRPRASSEANDLMVQASRTLTNFKVVYFDQDLDPSQTDQACSSSRLSRGRRYARDRLHSFRRKSKEKTRQKMASWSPHRDSSYFLKHDETSDSRLFEDHKEATESKVRIRQKSSENLSLTAFSSLKKLGDFLRASKKQSDYELQEVKNIILIKQKDSSGLFLTYLKSLTTQIIDPFLRMTYQEMMAQSLEKSKEIVSHFEKLKADYNKRTQEESSLPPLQRVQLDHFFAQIRYILTSLGHIVSMYDIIQQRYRLSTYLTSRSEVDSLNTKEVLEGLSDKAKVAVLIKKCFQPTTTRWKELLDQEKLIVPPIICRVCEQEIYADNKKHSKACIERNELLNSQKTKEKSHSLEQVFLTIKSKATETIVQIQKECCKANVKSTEESPITKTKNEIQTPDNIVRKREIEESQQKNAARTLNLQSQQILLAPHVSELIPPHETRKRTRDATGLSRKQYMEGATPAIVEKKSEESSKGQNSGEHCASVNSEQSNRSKKEPTVQLKVKSTERQQAPQDERVKSHTQMVSQQIQKDSEVSTAPRTDKAASSPAMTSSMRTFSSLLPSAKSGNRLEMQQWKARDNIRKLRKQLRGSTQFETRAARVLKKNSTRKYEQPNIGFNVNSFSQSGRSLSSERRILSSSRSQISRELQSSHNRVQVLRKTAKMESMLLENLKEMANLAFNVSESGHLSYEQQRDVLQALSAQVTELLESVKEGQQDHRTVAILLEFNSALVKSIEQLNLLARVVAKYLQTLPQRAIKQKMADKKSSDHFADKMKAKIAQTPLSNFKKFFRHLQKQDRQNQRVRSFNNSRSQSSNNQSAALGGTTTESSFQTGLESSNIQTDSNSMGSSGGEKSPRMNQRQILTREQKHSQFKQIEQLTLEDYEEADEADQSSLPTPGNSSDSLDEERQADMVDPEQPGYATLLSGQMPQRNTTISFSDVESQGRFASSYGDSGYSVDMSPRAGIAWKSITQQVPILQRRDQQGLFVQTALKPNYEIQMAPAVARISWSEPSSPTYSSTSESLNDISLLEPSYRKRSNCLSDVYNGCFKNLQDDGDLSSRGTLSEFTDMIYVERLLCPEQDLLQDLERADLEPPVQFSKEQITEEVKQEAEDDGARSPESDCSSISGEDEVGENSSDEVLNMARIRFSSNPNLPSHLEACQIEEQDDKPMTIQDFVILKQLSEGAYGKVVLAKKKATRDLFAIKILNKSSMVEKNVAQFVMNERDILNTVDSEYIVRGMWTFQDETDLYMVMEYMKGGDFDSLLAKMRPFNHESAKFYLAHIVLALEYLHSRGIVHRDLKPDNMLVGADGHIKLTDFGLSEAGLRKIKQSWQENLEASSQPAVAGRALGTADYMAPEVILEAEVNYLLDFWSLGVIAFECLTGNLPFNDNSVEKILRNVLHKEIPFPDEDNSIQEEAKQLLRQLLQRDPKKRLGSTRGIDELKDHPFFEGIDWSNLIKEIAPCYPRNKDQDMINFPKATVFKETKEEKVESSLDTSKQSQKNRTFQNFDGVHLSSLQAMNEKEGNKAMRYAERRKKKMEEAGKKMNRFDDKMATLTQSRFNYKWDGEKFVQQDNP